MELSLQFLISNASGVEQPFATRELPLVRAAVLESVRLWPTTPAILRETTEPTEWSHGLLPAETLVFVFAPFFHRDDERLPEADRFAPELWREERSAEDWPLVPFSEGPGECAGRNLVLMTTSTLLARLLSAGEWELTPKVLAPDQPLPRTLSPRSLPASASAG